MGPIKKIIRGVNKLSLKPCGFCFVEYFDREHAKKAIFELQYLEIEGSELKIDFDYGFQNGR